jgi:hypothetical protein
MFERKERGLGRKEGSEERTKRRFGRKFGRFRRKERTQVQKDGTKGGRTILKEGEEEGGSEPFVLPQQPLSFSFPLEPPTSREGRKKGVNYK